MDIQRFAVDVFHDQVGVTVVGGAAIDQAGNAGVLQAGKDADFLRETMLLKTRELGGVQHLDGDGFLELAVGPEA